MPIPLQPGIVYGPVRSRRLGWSLGINLQPPGTKICTMNCAYCQYGWTREAGRRVRWPTPARIEAAVARRLRTAAATGELIDRITVAGNGEPTLHPGFEEIAERLARLRDRLAPGIPLAILSNSTTAGWESVRRGLALFDERHMKLDAGDSMTYARINGSLVPFGSIVDALRNLPRIIVQSMFVSDAQHDVDNTTDTAVSAWVDALDTIQPTRVELYTLDRPAARRDLRPASQRRLREIAARVRAAGLLAQVVPP